MGLNLKTSKCMQISLARIDRAPCGLPPKS